VTHDRQLEMSYFRDIAPNYLSNHHSNSALRVKSLSVLYGQLHLLGNVDCSVCVVLCPPPLRKYLQIQKKFKFFYWQDMVIAQLHNKMRYKLYI